MKINVLIVDDYRPMAEMLALVMEMKGYTVEWTCKPWDVFKILERFIPDVVLCDIEMPGMSGTELCSHLRSDPRLKETVFIAETGLDQFEAKKLISEAGFDYHVVKPIDIGLLGGILIKHFGEENAN